MEKIQFRMRVMWGFCSFIVLVLNLIYLLQDVDLFIAIQNNSVYLIFLNSIYFFTISMFKNKLFPMFPIIGVFALSSISILDLYTSFYGFGLYILGILLLAKYKFFDNKTILQIFLLCVFLFSIIGVSIFFNIFEKVVDITANRVIIGLNVIIFLIVFSLSFYIIYYDEIIWFTNKKSYYSLKIEFLEREKSKLISKIFELEESIDKIKIKNSSINFSDFKITKREKEVIKRLVLYKENAREIASSLNISYWTVNEHFRHIRCKFQVNSKEEIIELCRNNF